MDSHRVWLNVEIQKLRQTQVRENTNRKHVRWLLRPLNSDSKPTQSSRFYDQGKVQHFKASPLWRTSACPPHECDTPIESIDKSNQKISAISSSLVAGTRVRLYAANREIRNEKMRDDG